MGRWPETSPRRPWIRRPTEQERALEARRNLNGMRATTDEGQTLWVPMVESPSAPVRVHLDGLEMALIGYIEKAEYVVGFDELSTSGRTIEKEGRPIHRAARGLFAAGCRHRLRLCVQLARGVRFARRSAADRVGCSRRRQFTPDSSEQERPGRRARRSDGRDGQSESVTKPCVATHAPQVRGLSPYTPARVTSTPPDRAGTNSASGPPDAATPSSAAAESDDVDAEAASGDDVLDVLEPFAVWTGSFNWTANGTDSLENAVYIENQQVAEAFYNEFAQVFYLSAPLNWDDAWHPERQDLSRHLRRMRRRQNPAQTVGYGAGWASGRTVGGF